MTIFTAICCAIFLYLIMRNVSAYMEFKKYAADNALYVMKEDRPFVKIGRIFCIVCMAVVIGFFIYDVCKVESFFDVDAFRPLALVLGFGFFGFVPFSTCRWVLTHEGVYLYNSNRFIPWSEMITTGIQKRKKGKTFLVLQTKKAQGELFKQTFYMMRIKEADAENVNQTIRDFIHTLDKMKMLKHIKEEREQPKKKRTWY